MASTRNGYLSQIWKLGSLKIKVLADLGSNEDVLPDLQMAVFLTCLHMEESRGVFNFLLNGSEKRGL